MNMQNNFGTLPRTNNAGDNTAFGLASGFNFGAATQSNGGFDLAASGGVNGPIGQMNGQNTQQGLGIAGVNGVGNAGGGYQGQLGLNTQGLPSPQSYTDSPNLQSQTGSHGFPTPQLPFGGMPGVGMPQSMFMPQQMQMFGMGAPMSALPQSQMQMTPHVSMGPPPLPTMQQSPVTPTMNQSSMYNEQQQQMAQMAQLQMQMQMMMMAGMIPNATPSPGPTSFEPSAALEKELVVALQEMEKYGRTWKQVIIDFASKRGQSSNHWKDYYLEHSTRIDTLVSNATSQNILGVGVSAATPPSDTPAPPRKVKKPILDRHPSLEIVKGPTITIPRITKRPTGSNNRMDSSEEDVKPTKAELRAASAANPPVKRTRGRPSNASIAGATATVATTSSPDPRYARTAVSVGGNPLKRKAAAPVTEPARRPAPHTSRIPLAETTKKLPLLQADVIIPPVRTHSPTPPTEVVPHPSGRPGNIYTRADRDFFVDFIQYELARDPDLSKNELCDMLHAKARHHSSESWKSHWSSRHAVADNILRLAAERVAARERAALRDLGADSDSDATPSRGKKMVPNSTSFAKQPAAKSRVLSPSDSEDDGDGQDVPTEWSNDEKEEGHMGGRDAMLTKMDMRMMAKHIAAHSAGDWKCQKNRTRWQLFAQKHTQRSADAWASHYSRRKRVILDLVTRFRQRAKKRAAKGLDTGLRPRKQKAPAKSAAVESSRTAVARPEPITSESSVNTISSTGTSPPPTADPTLVDETEGAKPMVPDGTAQVHLPFKSRWKFMQGRVPTLSAATFPSSSQSGTPTTQSAASLSPKAGVKAVAGSQQPVIPANGNEKDTAIDVDEEMTSDDGKDVDGDYEVDDDMELASEP